MRPVLAKCRFVTSHDSWREAPWSVFVSHALACHALLRSVTLKHTALFLLYFTPVVCQLWVMLSRTHTRWPQSNRAGWSTGQSVSTEPTPGLWKKKKKVSWNWSHWCMSAMFPKRNTLTKNTPFIWQDHLSCALCPFKENQLQLLGFENVIVGTVSHKIIKLKICLWLHLQMNFVSSWDLNQCPKEQRHSEHGQRQVSFQTGWKAEQKKGSQRV